MPVLTFASMDEIPAELQGNAEKNEAGKFQLDVVAKVKLDEFRTNNVEVATERDALKTQVTALAAVVGEDPDAFVDELRTLRETAQQVADGKLKKSTDIEDQLASRTAAMKTAHEAALADKAGETDAWKSKAVGWEGRYKKTIVANEIRAAALKKDSGANVEALDIIVDLGLKVFSADDEGKTVAKQGDNIVYGTDGTTPLSPSEWMNSLKTSHSYLFNNSEGGGARGGKETSIGGMSKADFNKLPASQRLALARAG